MIYFDSIISSLQSGGGVSVYFGNIVSRMNLIGESFISIEYSMQSSLSSQFKFKSSYRKSRYFERYRSVPDTSADIFHSSYYRLPSSKDSKVVTTVHDFIYEKYVKGPAQWIHCWQKYRAIKQSDIVICVSNSTAKDLMYYCPVDPSKIRVIHNGVSDNYYPLENQLANTNEVLFVGSRSGYKNFNLAVETIACLPELSLSIVGGGILSQAEINLLERLIPNRYQWLGRLTDEELNVTFNRAYALLYPSSYEGFGIPIIESMRAGCPVVAVNTSSIPEVAGSAAILVDFPVVDKFVQSLMLVESQRDTLIKLGYMQASKFSWDKCFEETLKVYKELI